MTELDKTIQYQTQQNPNGRRWTAIMYPDDLKIAEVTYNEHIKNYPNVDFRIIKIETIRSVLK